LIRGLRHFGGEFVEDLGEEGKCWADGIFLVCYYDGRQLLRSSTIIHVCGVVVLLYALSLALGCAFGYGLGKKGHEFANRALLIK